VGVSFSYYPLYGYQCPSKINYGEIQSDIMNIGLNENSEGPINSISDTDLLSKNNNTLNYDYYLFIRNLQKGQYSDADDILHSMPVRFILTPEQNKEYQSFLKLFKIYKDLKVQSKTFIDLNQEQVIELKEISRDDFLSGAYARNILIAADKITYIEPVSLPDFTFSDQKLPENMLVSKSFKIHPNPAGDFFILENNLDKDDLGGALMSVYNSTGSKIFSDNLKGIKQKINTKEWPSGLYLVCIEIRGKVQETLKVNIIR